MRVAIIGSRTVQLDTVDSLLALLPEDTEEIVSGGAKGADTIAARAADRLSLPLTEFLPDYERYGRRAPLVRNLDIIRAADCVIALWDGSSRGTVHVIDRCRREQKPVRVYLCRDGGIGRALTENELPAYGRTAHRKKEDLP